MAAPTLTADTEALLQHQCRPVGQELLHLPGPDFIDRCLVPSGRPPQVLRALGALYGHGRLGGTGYLSILPVDQGIEHTAGASFAPNPAYFDPDNIIRLALEGGCNAVVTTLGTFGAVARRYAHKLPFVVKINHNELLTFPNTFNQVLFGSVRQAWDLGATAVGATVYFGSEEGDRQLTEVAAAFEEAHRLGLATVLWCYLRNNAFKTNAADYHLAADVTGQANHLGATIGADLLTQKLPETNGGFPALRFGKTHPAMYQRLSADNPIDLARYQVLNCYAGRVGLLHSGSESLSVEDLSAGGQEAVVRAAIVNKRAGGQGLVVGRKAFQRPFAEGVGLLHAIQDVYLDAAVTIA